MNGRSRRRGSSSAEVQSDLQAVAMALLSRPWITKQDHPDEFLLIKDHYGYLRDWFHDHAGYSLLVTRAFAKLEKVPAVYRSWMGIDGFHQPRDYALFTYGLWYLEAKSDTDQFLLTEMVEAIRNHLLGSHFDVDWTLYDHRLSMVRALKKLRALGVLTSIEGEETGWARDGASANVLYEASPLARYLLRRFPKELMAYSEIEALYEVEQTTTVPVGDELLHNADVRSRRQKVFRRLLMEPIVYDWEWTDDERRYVQTKRPWIISQMGEMVGLQGRRFREGLYFHWPELMAEVDLFPTQSAASDVTMLLAAQLREAAAQYPDRYPCDENGCFRLTRSEFEGLLLAVRDKSEAYWTKEHRDKSTTLLAEDILAHMVEWNLAAPDDLGGILLLPGLSRFCGEYAAVID
ncbi:TIGR02678 family protein [Alicyclobacillus dauci]|uniref:TIGR02678 family protein n=1 Tax=Alicyclobacillus dauci TaxID=1475485 RepID=A0ABY6Z305_9BACL|nr:TIGR02678 family protein [Alicyclobacillus dauci]WAH36350.1 TIGR02678 family protein [Alicyclobacillus dauci]WAH39383.1 TIGR02678 family protein [Alicyclobacillus dauci]